MSAQSRGEGGVGLWAPLAQWATPAVSFPPPSQPRFPGAGRVQCGEDRGQSSHGLDGEGRPSPFSPHRAPSQGGRSLFHGRARGLASIAFVQPLPASASLLLELFEGSHAQTRPRLVSIPAAENVLLAAAGPGRARLV